MKTISQIVQEYKNRQENPEYTMLGIIEGHHGSQLVYSNVTNFVAKHIGNNWFEMEFDSFYNGEHRRVAIKSGQIVRSVITNKHEVKAIKGDGKKYKKIVVCTHPGERETFVDVSNITEDKVNRIIEFDTTGMRLSDAEGYQKLHVVKNPGSLEHSEEILS